MQALRNRWHCVAFSHELGPAPLGRVILGEPVVLYRTGGGAAVALEDRCCHRRVPLSKGRVEGDNLRCLYHGFLYDASGAVVWIPGQDRVPPGAGVRAYPVVERHGWVWIWPGDSALADPADAPAYDKYDDPSWASYGALVTMDANYFLAIDNLLDLSHLAFLHINTIGSPDDIDPELTWERGADWVRGVRMARDLRPTPRFIAQGIDFNYDRKQVMLFEPPAQVTIDLFTNEAGFEYGDPNSRINQRMIIYNAVTPETETSALYFWAIARDHDVDDAKASEFGFNSTSAAFAEDKDMLEAQQRSFDAAPAAPQVDVGADTGSLQARRITEALLAQESGSALARTG